MTTPLSGGRYIRDKKTGARVRVPEEQNPVETASIVTPAETDKVEATKPADAERKGK